MKLGREAASRRTFHTLDGLRGVAAITVVLYHYRDAVAPVRFDSAYLAVDLFFALSGFVLAFAYGEALASSLRPARFLLLRVVRLYPLYLLGVAIALAPALGALVLGRAQTWTWPSMALAAPSALAFLPSPPLPGRPPVLYPFDEPAWSLAFELAINLVFALLIRWRLARAMPAIVALAGLAIVATGLAHGSLDGGSEWPGWWIGLARVSLSFFLGVALFQTHAAGRLPALRCPAWALLGATGVLLWYAPPPDWRPGYDILCVLLLFPAIVALAVSNEPRRGVDALAVLGLLSYPLYTIHVPCQTLLLGTLDRLLGDQVARYAPWTGFALVGGLFIVSWLLATTYDPIVRRWLGRHLGFAVPRVP